MPGPYLLKSRQRVNSELEFTFYRDDIGEATTTNNKFLKVETLKSRSNSRTPSRFIDSGGDFKTVKVEDTILSEAAGVFWPTLGSSYMRIEGGVNIPPPEIGAVELGLKTKFPEYYRRMKPSKPVFTPVNSLYELKDMPRMLKQRFERNFLGLSNFHIAMQFGWKPFLNDLVTFRNLHQKAEKKLNWLIRHNGRPIRVRREFENTEESFTDTYSSGSCTSMNNGLFEVGLAEVSEVHTISKKLWASARVRYWLPNYFFDGSGKWGPFDRNLSRVKGAYISPETVYKAIPWSWLLDWFSNVGDVLGNMQSDLESRYASDYFYVMGSYEHTCVRSATPTLYTPDGTFPVFLSTKRSVKQKERYAGNPFSQVDLNFDMNFNALNSTQRAILASLGFIRASRVYTKKLNHMPFSRARIHT